MADEQNPNKGQPNPGQQGGQQVQSPNRKPGQQNQHPGPDQQPRQNQGNQNR
jgi:hypothetical protein